MDTRSDATDATQPFAAFRHLAADAERHRAVLDAFRVAKRQFLVHLRPDDVVDITRDAGITLSRDIVEQSLGALKDWGNLRATPDTGRVTSVEDFNRARYLYALTPEGEAVEEALAAYAGALDRRGALQSVALADIATNLTALAELADEPDPARVAATLRDLDTVLANLAANAQAFLGSLQRTVDLYEVDLEAFLGYKERLIGYLERFVGDLTIATHRIARLLADLEPVAEQLLALAADRDAADAAPGDEDAEQAARTRALADRRAAWDGLRRWFTTVDGRASQASQLRSRASSAIPTLLGVVASMHDRRLARSDRAADFRALARWFAEAPDDLDAHRLWRGVFGLAPSRHLTVDADTLDTRAADGDVDASTPWAEAPPVVIHPRLRALGTTRKRGRLPTLVDRRGDLELLRARVAAQSAQIEAARRELVSDHPRRLSELADLADPAFRLFLDLLADALSARPGRDGRRHSTSADGRIDIVLTPTRDGRSARIVTAEGALCGDDHLVEITDTAGRQAARVAAG